MCGGEECGKRDERVDGKELSHVEENYTEQSASQGRKEQKDLWASALEKSDMCSVIRGLAGEGAARTWGIGMLQSETSSTKICKIAELHVDFSVEFPKEI